MTKAIESVDVLDPDVQDAWHRVTASGVGELAAAYVLSTAVVGLARAGVARRLRDTWVDLPDLVPAGGEAALVAGVLRYLEVRGVVESDGDRWRRTARGATLFDELPESLLGYYVEAYGPVLNRMAAQLTGAERYGTHVTRDTEALGRRCEVLFRSFGTKLVADLAREHGATSVLDLGCGTGGLVMDLCRENPALRAVGVDIAPDAVRYATARAEREGLSERVSFVVGDAFAPRTWPPEVTGCDFLVAVGALHEHFRDGEDAVVRVLRGYADLLAGPGTKAFLLAEPELLVDPADVDFYLLHVLTAQGMPRPRAAWLDVIARAGLVCDRVFSAPNTGFRFAYYELRAGTAA